jgi:cell division protein FtsI (penicillin-binding protein 3)
MSAVISRRRLAAFAVGVSIVLVGLTGWVASLQTVRADDFRQASVSQRLATEKLPAARGAIFDRNGAELALSVPSWTVFADPKYVRDPVGTAVTLSSLFGLSPERSATLAERLAAPKSRFVYVVRQVEEALADAVTSLGLPGVAVYQEPERVLAGGDLARSVIGRTDPDGVGISGVELLFDDTLRGVDGVLEREFDRAGRSIPAGRSTVVAAEPGDDLVLSIDRSIQFQVERALLRRAAELSARRATAVVMDSSTGDLLAVGSVDRSDDGVYRVTTANLAAVTAHEPGSVAKVITTAAALDEGLVGPETTYQVPGSIEVDDFVITDAYPHGLEPMTVREILTKSSNIGTTMLSQALGRVRQHDYMRAFGFGERTAVAFPGESAGILKPSGEWRGTERLTVSYGYGFAATALQLAAAVNVIANDGEYVAPRLVRATVDARGRIVEAPASPTRTVLRSETATTMAALMRDVVCSGTAKLAQVDGVSVAGKTGTGYKAQDNGTYVDDRGNRAYFATFAGFLPAGDPKVTVLVSIDEPDPSTRDRFGGTAAAPVFAEIAKILLHELQIEPPADDRGCAAESG